MAGVLSTRWCLVGAGVPMGSPISIAESARIANGGKLRAALERLRATSTIEYRGDLPEGAILLAIGIDELSLAVRERMGGAQAHGRDAVVWTRDGAELLVFLPCALRLTGGYLIAQFDVESLETGRAEVRLVFFLGNVQSGSGKAASVTHSAEAPALLMDTWGETFRSVVWEAVLDVIEGAAVLATETANGPMLRLLGFIGGEDRIVIAVGA